MNLFSTRIVGLFLLLVLTTLTVQAAANSVPVSVEFRRGLQNQSVYASRFQNTSDKTLSIEVLMERGAKLRKIFSLKLAPQQTKEIGITQGWKGLSGDRVTVSSAGYAAFSEEIP